MRIIYRLTAAIIVSVGLSACNKDTTDTQTLESVQQKASYSYGVDVATRLKQQGIELDIKALNRGIADAYTGNTLALNDEELAEVSGRGRAMRDFCRSQCRRPCPHTIQEVANVSRRVRASPVEHRLLRS